MTTEELKAKVLGVIGNVIGKEIKDIKVEDKLAEDLGMDELDAVEVIMGLEEVFDITISDEEAEKLSTVDDVVAYVYSKTEKESGK